MKRALSHVFPKIISIMTGFLFLGFSLGMLAVSKDFPPYLPVLMSLFIFAGSMEFVTAVAQAELESREYPGFYHCIAFPKSPSSFLAVRIYACRLEQGDQPRTR